MTLSSTSSAPALYGPETKGSCHWCKRRIAKCWLPKKELNPLSATRDHVVPRSQGGKEWVWSCLQCNSLKGDMGPEEWAAFMADHPDYWMLPSPHFTMRRWATERA